MHLFCFGLGYTARHLVERLTNNPTKIWQFSGTSRIDAKLPNINTYVFDELHYLPTDITHILISIPPKDSGDLVIEKFAKHLPKLKNLKWIGYLSTTGVYGDCKGNWVDETSPLNPGNQFSKNRVNAEMQWLALMQEHNIPLHIFRLSGIYGPSGRNPIEKIMQGNIEIIYKPNQYFSRIHITDIVNILSRSMQNPSPGEVFNLADDLPSPPDEVLQYAYKLLVKTAPAAIPYEKATLSEMGKAFYSQSRRVKNDKVKTFFELKLIYPTYKEGLQAILTNLHL
jgi:nucleoside-diphosphate-sugar epimerase